MLMVKVIPGTHGFCHFAPLSSTSIGAKRISVDESWVGLIEDIDKDLRDARVKFMCPKCTAMSYYWPTFDYVCWVLDENVLHTISIPTIVTGRQYRLQQWDYDILDKILNLKQSQAITTTIFANASHFLEVYTASAISIL